MKIYFVRHGETGSNERQRRGERTVEMDEPLNEVGLRQAKQLAEELKDVHFDAIFCSPLRRAQQTAAQINAYHHLPITTLDGLHERKGGKVSSLDDWHALFDFDKNIAVPGGETITEFYERVADAIQHVKNLPNDQTVLVVAHGGVHHVMHAEAKKLPRVGNIRIDRMNNCAVRIYEFD